MSDGQARGEPSLRHLKAYRLGVWIQGLALGLLLFIALVELYLAAGGIRLFRYQGF